ncbi:MAG: Holliday junction branch migration DNA helicase RuvB [Acidimicrobiales bacterium]|nr:Holliday junction branch migration DNA helicase RuvB [Acidimicrobiaceae bacterium]MXX43384.1 Holliday junction branch migration DNA helicase RuvB [Acidimicrobiales bacterium]MYD34830.1 Holliday junction branch migration DNA helicase RuvB [Acidimicrobiales bacterium]MYI10802.1 Holliday junction branch migration DNA helicase RuvB [Acidimicrobiales bacterium]
MSAGGARSEGYRRDESGVSAPGRSEVTDPASSPADDGDAEASLRPRSLEEFIGQPEVREHVAITLRAALARGQTPDHLLFAGPPGLGKTTLAGIIAAELNAALHLTSGPAVERAGDLAAILTNLADGDVLFIDEIHRLPKVVEEVLYPAMEDFAIDIVLGKGPAARSIRFELPRFTLVGATTRTGLISGPLRDRFGLVERLDYYSTDDLEAIVARAAGILGVDIDAEGAAEIASRSRGTPRIANRLLRRVRDFAEVRASGAVDVAVAQEGLAAFGVDELGLDKVDRAILDALAVTHAGRPLGLSTLAISVGEQTETVEDVYEPFLIQRGLLQRTPRGRIATAAAYAHLGVEAPPATDDPGSVPGAEAEISLFDASASSTDSATESPAGAPVEIDDTAW